MIKVLSVVDGFGWGGTKEQVYLLARELSKREDIDIHMAISFQYQEMVDRLKDYNVKFHFFENHQKPNRLNPMNYYRLWKIIKEGDFDIVLANSPHTLDFVRVVYLFLKKKPKLITVKRSASIPSSLSKNLKYKISDKIVCVSKEMENILKKNNFLPEKLITIESGIDFSKFKPENKKERRLDFGVHLNSVLFINVANWNPQVKGQDKLIETFAKLDCKNCYLMLVGLDTDKYAPEIAKKFNIENRVIALGFRKDVPELLNMADFFVFSSYLEGIAGAVLQAMATGKVVISTLAGGIGEYLKDGYNGFAIEVGDFEGLRKKMEYVLNLPQEEYERISKNAIQTASYYSIQNTTDKYVKLFKELVSEKNY